MNKVLITGAHGQDGIILSKILLKKKYEVYGLDKVKNNNKFFYKVDLINIKLTNQIYLDIPITPHAIRLPA